jgi:signal peptidase II
MNKIRHLIYVILLIVIDQLTKLFAVARLKDQESISIIPNVLRLYYHENTGAVWGILSDRTTLLALFSIVILCVMIFFYFKIPNEKHYNYLRLIIVFLTAGAIGNLIDRIARKFVVDFIYFELIDFPIFNVADMYVSVSAFCLVLLTIFYYKDDDFSFLSNKDRKKHEG